MSELSEPKTRERALIVLLFFCLILMTAVLVFDRLTHPGLTVQRSPDVQHFQANQDMITKDMDEIGAMMQLLRNHPDDTALMLRLVDALMKAERWDAAEQFARRALSSDPESFSARFLMGIILHKRGADEEAAASLRQALAIKDDGPAHYSLAILYLYFLNKKEEGMAELKAALALPDLSDELRRTLEDEFAKQNATTGAQNPVSDGKNTKE